MEVHIAVYRDQIACKQPVATVRQHIASRLGSRGAKLRVDQRMAKQFISNCQQQVIGQIQEVCCPQRNTGSSALPAIWQGAYLGIPDPT